MIDYELEDRGQKFFPVTSTPALDFSLSLSLSLYTYGSTAL
jgi:hypothetical protein